VVPVFTVVEPPVPECAHVNAPAPETTSQDSRGPRVSLGAISGLDALGIALTAAAFLGAVLLIAADFFHLFEIKVLTVTRETRTGGSHHSYAMVVLGLAALPMAYGATRGSRPAMAAVAGLGAIALLIALVGDLPDVNETGVIGRNFTDAEASPSTGFYLETLGAVLLVVSGGGGLLLTGRSPRVPREPRVTPADGDEERAARAAARAEARARARRERR
jgi:hypothetical protein